MKHAVKISLKCAGNKAETRGFIFSTSESSSKFFKEFDKSVLVRILPKFVGVLIILSRARDRCIFHPVQVHRF